MSFCSSVLPWCLSIAVVYEDAILITLVLELCSSELGSEIRDSGDRRTEIFDPALLQDLTNGSRFLIRSPGEDLEQCSPTDDVHERVNGSPGITHIDQIDSYRFVEPKGAR